MNTILKNIFLSLLGLVFTWFVAFLLPLWIVASLSELFPLEIGGLRFIGWIPIVLGASAFLWCYWTFISIGKGTPWPFDPPKNLVTTGLYGYVRNPMEGSYLLILLGEVLLYESSALIFYLLFNFLYLHIRQIVVQEPRLRRRFGESYEHYCKSVPRWIPSIEAYQRED